jgi:FKBP-type peptidyl-prolyl cis-trans isomerase 2
MKKYILVLLCLTLLWSCAKKEAVVNKESTWATPEVVNTLTNNSWTTMTNSTGTIQSGSKVSVLYTGSLEDGTIFDASSKHGGKPLEFTAGAGQMIPGFDKGVMGMKVGESKKIEIEAKDAYGEYDNTKKQQVEKTKLKDFLDHGFKLEKGEKIPTQFGNLLIVATDDKTVTLDLNHELAGKKLTFEVEVTDIK